MENLAQKKLINALIELTIRISQIEKVKEIAYNLEGNKITIWIYADISLEEENITRKIIDIEHDILRKYKELLLELDIIPLKDLNYKKIPAPKEFQIISLPE
ncbi:MAG: hypothetical protein JHC31_15900 [Sulfurihydrogenibium sp.]|jgi:hypothetical protein|nr:hypothetical protein [Sulfurihydrogenibium sp.]